MTSFLKEMFLATECSQIFLNDSLILSAWARRTARRGCWRSARSASARRSGSTAWCPARAIPSTPRPSPRSTTSTSPSPAPWWSSAGCCARQPEVDLVGERNVQKQTGWLILSIWCIIIITWICLHLLFLCISRCIVPAHCMHYSGHSKLRTQKVLFSSYPVSSQISKYQLPVNIVISMRKLLTSSLVPEYILSIAWVCVCHLFIRPCQNLWLWMALPDPCFIHVK